LKNLKVVEKNTQLYLPFFPVIAQPAVFTGVKEREQIADTVGVTVETLQVFDILYNRVGTEEASYNWVVHPSVHILQIKEVDMFVPGKSAVGQQSRLYHTVHYPDVWHSLQLCQR